MKLLFCSLIAGLICVSSHAQQQNFVEVSHYLFPEFTQGIVLMKDGKQNKALLNYNSLTEQMLFQKNGQKMAISFGDMHRTDTVFIESRKFVVLNNKFVELLHHSTWGLYVEHKCKLEEPGKPSGYGGTSHTSASTSMAAYYSEGSMVWDLQLPDGYKAKPYVIYWLSREEELISFMNLRELRNLYKDKKDLYKEFSKSNRLKYHEPETVIQLIGFLESN